MMRVDDGVYVCEKSHRWLDDTPEPAEEYWVPDGVSLSYVEGTVKGGGHTNCGPSPARQKQDAYLRRIMPGSHARNIPLGDRPIRLTKSETAV